MARREKRDYLLLIRNMVVYDVSRHDADGNRLQWGDGRAERRRTRESTRIRKMEPKKPPKRRAATSVAAGTRRDATAGGPVILDFVKCRIEAFNREQGGGATVTKDDTGYTLASEDTGIPVAKLRRKGKRGEFQVLYWNRETGRWRMVSLFGGSVFTLDEALDFISNDPMECFWS
jgi:hypothetical protein